MRAGRLAALGTELGLEADPGAVDDHLSRMLEVHRDPLSDHRLHLPQSPVGTLGMAHQHPGLEEFVHPPSPGGVPPMSTPDLSALVSARLCHDLISPMGAIGNGLELMNISATPGSAELALVHDSLNTALAKLRFFRIAFGPADPQARQSMDEAAQLTEDMFHGRFTVSWPHTG